LSLIRQTVLNIVLIAACLPLVLAEDSSMVAKDTVIARSESTGNEGPDSAFIANSADSSWWVRKIDNPAFGVGEYLEFGLTYGILAAGTAIMKIPDITDYNGKQCYRIVSIAYSNSFLSTFYTVRDTVESLIDIDGIFTHYFRKHLREGKYRTDKITIFDQRSHLAITDKDTIATYSFVQDVLSSLYYIRTQQIEMGKDIYIDNHTDRKNYPLRVIVHGREKIEVPAGKFNCLVVEPVMRYEGIFKAKGKIKIWLTDDQYKIPVKMQSEVNLLGSISAKLKKLKYGEIKQAG